MPRRSDVDLTGQRFGRLAVVCRADGPAKERRGIPWRCRCVCGAEVLVETRDLTRRKGGCAACPALVRPPTTEAVREKKVIHLVRLKGRRNMEMRAAAAARLMGECADGG